MNRILKLPIMALATAIALVGALGWASNFVDDNTSTPLSKTDRIPVTNPTQQWSASDANFTFNALKDIRTVLKRDPQIVFNVRAFGATGNGVVNDYPAIAAAMAAAVASAPSGQWAATVYFPPGVYLIGCNPGCSPLILANGVRLKGDTAANTIIRAAPSFSSTALIKNQTQNGLQEYAFIEGLQIDGNKDAGAICSEAVVSWGSLFINSYIKDTIIENGSAVGLHLFADGSPGGTGPVLIENAWVIRNGGHNILIEDKTTNTGAFAGITFVNLASEQSGANSAAVYVKGNGHGGQLNMWNTHIEQGGSATHRTGIVLDGIPFVNLYGVQLQTGSSLNMDAGIRITSNFRNLQIQIRGVTNINVIDPVIQDLKNGVVFGGVNVAVYNTPDVTLEGQRFIPGGANTVSSWVTTTAYVVGDRVTNSGHVYKCVVAGTSGGSGPSATVVGGTEVDGTVTWLYLGDGTGVGSVSAAFANTAGTDVAWFDATGALTGSSPSGSALDVYGDATNDRTVTLSNHAKTRAFGWFFPDSSNFRLRYYTGGVNLLNFDNSGNGFIYNQMTFQGVPIVQQEIVARGGGVPTLSSCGTSPTVTSGSTKFAGDFTTGSGATTCTVTFASSYSAAPTCVLTGSGAASPTYTTSTTAITLSVSVASTKYYYICVGH